MRPLVLIFVLALTLAACSGEQISEQIAEEAIGGNANVEIEGEGDDVTINIESDEGSISIGSGGDVPNEITVPLPDGAVVVSSVVVGNGASVGVEYPTDRYDEIAAFYDSWTSGSGGTWLTSESAFPHGDGQTVRNMTWQAEESVMTVILRDCYSLDGTFEGPLDTACLSISQAPGN